MIWQSIHPATLKRTINLFSFWFYCSCSSRRYFPFSHDTSCSRITFEIVIILYLSLKLLSNISPSGQYLSGFQTCHSEKEICLGPWVPSRVQFCNPGKPLDWGSTPYGTLFSCVKTTPQSSSFALQQLCCLSAGFSSCLSIMVRVFWAAGSMEFVFVRDVLTKRCFCIKSSIVQGHGNGLVVNLGTGSSRPSRKTHLRTISQGFVQNTSR